MQINGVVPHGLTKHDSTVLTAQILEYTGNGAANRALPHTLGHVPKFGVAVAPLSGYIVVMTKIDQVNSPGDSYGAHTEWTDTNVYVTGNANVNAAVYTLMLV